MTSVEQTVADQQSKSSLIVLELQGISLKQIQMYFTMFDFFLKNKLVRETSFEDVTVLINQSNSCGMITFFIKHVVKNKNHN